jgi:hypothetical protein
MGAKGGSDVLPEAIAVLGYSLELPQGIDSGDKLFDAVRDKRQIAAHRDEVQFPQPSLYDVGHTGTAWKYRVLRGTQTRIKVSSRLECVRR